mgnify:CR=1 FL=1
MTIKISNGEVTIKDFCPRKLKKEINKALFSSVEMESDGKARGFSMLAMDNANDVAMIGMIESITINGEIKEISIDMLDNMDSKDVDRIIEEINKITNPAPPKA